jgi:di- and tripeptidase
MSRLDALRQQQSLTPRPQAAGNLSETDDQSSTSPATSFLSRQPSRDVGYQQSDLPTLSHRLKHTSSILTIALGEDYIYAGTQAGEILVFGLETYERKAVIDGHRGSVLGLCLSDDGTLLFSSAGDRIVNVWSAKTLVRVGCLYSSYDVGDIFCVAYSDSLRTVYLGAQNTTISWCSLVEQDQSDPSARILHPSLRDDPFFDSKGPGGRLTPKPPNADVTPKHAVGGQTLEIPKENVMHFAHYGYVNCMLLVKEGVAEAGGQEVLITGGGDGIVKLWTLDENNEGAIEQLYELDDGREEGHSILTLAIDGTFLYTGRSGGEVDVWDLETHQLVRNIKAHRDDVLSVCVGGGFLFSAAVTGYVRKFDRQYQLKSRLKAHEGRVLASAFTFHKRRPIYVTGASDSTLAIWDISDCSPSQFAASRTSNEMMVEYLRRFVSYRTVSSDPRHQADCRRGASYLRSVFKNFGATTEMLTTKDPFNPVILAKFRGNPATTHKRKKILFYGHYDVVAADNENGKWPSDPFEMEGIDGFLYGRGTSDNKGPIMAAIFACAELTSEQALDSDIIFLIEGEEECGSRGFEAAVKAAKDKIGEVDWILLANSYWLDDRIPCLTYGLRGVIHATVQVESSHPDLHSGVDGSAQLDESLKDLVMLLSTLTGKNGKVMIPGFYDPIPKLSDEERDLYVDITTALVQRNPDLGDPTALASSLMRRWREASLTIHRFQTSGPDNATIIPRLAKVALSLRLVPNQEANVVAAALTSYLHSQFDKLESTNKLTVTVDHQAEPWLGDWTNEIFKTLEEAIMEAWGPIDQSRRRRSSALPKVSIPTHHRNDNNNTTAKDSSPPSYFTSKLSPTTSTVLANGSIATPLDLTTPPDLSSQLSYKLSTLSTTNNSEPAQPPRRKPLYIREGGSIPAIRFLEKEFDAPAAHFPCGQASDSAHLDKERFRLLNLYKSRDIFKRVFVELPKK